MNPSSIYSKSGKGVQEASGKTSHLSRSDRVVLAAFDGRATLGEVAQKVGKPFDSAFEQIVGKLDKDGFIREVPGAAPPPPRTHARPAASKPAAPGADLDFSAMPPSKSSTPPPAPTPSPGGSSGLDFSTLGTPARKPSAPPAAKPASPPMPKPTAAALPSPPHATADAERKAQEQASSLAKARQEAEARAQRDRDRAKAEADAKLRAEMEAKLRAEAAEKGHADLEAKMRAEADAKVKAAREAAVRAAAEAKAKAEAEMKAKLAAERAKLEEERRKAEEERKAREESERKAREEAERLRKEAEEKARAEAEALRKQLEAERAKLEEERRKAEEERKRIEQERKEHERRAKEEAERRAKEEAERKAKEDAERKAKAEAERRARKEEEEQAKAREEEEEAKRAAEEKAAAVSAAAAETAPRMAVPPPQASQPDSFDDKLLADLDSFDKRDEEELKAKEREESDRRRAEEQERTARATAERKARDERERERAQEDERRLQEEARRARDEEERRQQAERDREREREAALLAAQSAAASKAQDDIGVSDADLDMDDVKQDQRVMAAKAKREEAIEPKSEHAPALARRGPPIKWGRIAGIAIVLAVVAGLAWLQFMPLPAAEFEKAASAALGRPVRIGSARLSLLTGLQMTFRDVRVGDDVRITTVRASPEFGTLFGGARKAFSRLDLEGASLPERALGDALFGKLKGANFATGRLVAHQLKLAEPLVLPPVDAEVAFAADGGMKTVTLTGAENLLATLTPKDGEVQFEMTAGQLGLPMAPEISFTDFSMKGSASPQGVKIESWDGALFGGRFSGAADLKWGSTWTAEGPLKVRGVNVAVFAPALLSEGKGEGIGHFSMHSADPEKLGNTLRVEGSFTVTKGTLGSIDLARAIETGSRQWSGRTQFNELNGQGVYEKGAVSLRNLTISAGAMNAGASVDVAASGALSGRIVADVKSATQTLRAAVNLGGTAKEPQVRN